MPCTAHLDEHGRGAGLAEVALDATGRVAVAQVVVARDDVHLRKQRRMRSCQSVVRRNGPASRGSSA